MCEEQGLELDESNTKLKRMTKPELNALLARKAEEAMKKQMANAVGVQSSCDPVIALGALRMVHDIMAGVAERGMDVVLPKCYECEGFVRSLNQPAVREATRVPARDSRRNRYFTVREESVRAAGPGVGRVPRDVRAKKNTEWGKRTCFRNGTPPASPPRPRST